jgi:hypothetical protein
VAGNVGGFDIGSASKFTWEALVWLDWRFGETTSLALGYRALASTTAKATPRPTSRCTGRSSGSSSGSERGRRSRGGRPPKGRELRTLGACYFATRARTFWNSASSDEASTRLPSDRLAPPPKPTT